MYLCLSIPHYSILREKSHFLGVLTNWTHDTLAYPYHGIISPWVPDAVASTVVWFKESFTTVVKLTYTIAKALFTVVNTSISHYVEEDPQTALVVSALVFFGPDILLLPFSIFLRIFGFGGSGIIGGSPAARYQSQIYGGNTPSGSLFSFLQSMGMRYDFMTTRSRLLMMIRWLAGWVFIHTVCHIVWKELDIALVFDGDI
ncbi:hypothetical protein MVEN_00351000 [Mycena venus]|uniref:Uncharacterized protein n=1 Tax=Mycena venus TaxID=2733690 RepID=A0A8H7D769_9AGAR|nr:hypothetical protein MVEN_00351000 [Mycena venus]